MNSKSDLVIIGAGLTGMALAYFLKDEKISIQILEARSHHGGRIKTVKKEGLAPIEMGATWFGKKHMHLIQLLEELKIGSFEQILGENAIYEPLSTSPPQLVKLPPNEDEISYRIKDGTISIIERLRASLASNCQVLTNEKVVALERTAKGVVIRTESKNFEARMVVSTLPPNLFQGTVSFKPEIPTPLKSIMGKTHTWMGESIKVGIHFKEPFWRDANSSGTIFSNVGPIQELYEHADHENTKFALKGFINGAYHSMEKEDRERLVLAQLRKYFGNKVDEYVHYEEKVWANDTLTYSAYATDIFPHQNNGNSVYQKPLFDGAFIIGGSETSAQFPGYMEGAIQSAKSIAKIIKSQGQW